MKTDKASKMSAGKMRNSAGSDYSAGNAVKGASKSPSFAGSKTKAVKNQGKRFTQTRTRRG